MGESRRKRAFAAMMEQIRDSHFDMLGAPAKQGAPLDRVELLGLLIEKAMLLGDGFTEPERDRLVAMLEAIDEKVGAAMQPIGAVAERVVESMRTSGEGGSGRAKVPLDPERLRLVEERAREVGEAIWPIVRPHKTLGFVLLMFEIGDRAETTYLSNCNRRDILTFLREYTDQMARGLDWPRQDVARH
jgi:hypothetical protein